MSTTNNRRPQPGRVTGETIALFVVIGFVLVTLVTVYAAAKFGHQLAGLEPIPADPWETLFGVLKGDVAWPMASTVIAGAVLAVLLILASLIGWAAARRGRRSTRVDHAARYMGRGRDVEPLTHKAATATAQRLGVQGSAGVPIGRTVGSSTSLFGSWEDMHIDIWGPRTGKTTSRAVPAILDAPGAVLVTSNKRDVLDATRDPRRAAGPVWVFDPQSVAREEPTEWWWNPLSYVTDEVRAAKMAEHFASGSRDPGARTDAFFDPSAQDLLAGLLLAAALDDRPITTAQSCEVSGLAWDVLAWGDFRVSFLKSGKNAVLDGWSITPQGSTAANLKLQDDLPLQATFAQLKATNPGLTQVDAFGTGEGPWIAEARLDLRYHWETKTGQSFRVEGGPLRTCE